MVTISVYDHARLVERMDRQCVVPDQLCNFGDIATSSTRDMTYASQSMSDSARFSFSMVPRVGKYELWT
jgi:hypothetical protein